MKSPWWHGFFLLLPLALLIQAMVIMYQTSRMCEHQELGYFFLAVLGLVHWLMSLMLDQHATSVRTKCFNSATMLATAGAYLVTNPWYFLILWTASSLPQILYFRSHQSQARAVYSLHHLVSVIFLLLAFNLLRTSDANWQLGAVSPEGGAHPWGVALLIAAAFLRQGIFPMHLWFKAGFKTKPFPLNIGFYLGNLGFFLFVRAILPLIEAHFGEWSVGILGWGIVSGLYFSNMALVQKKIRSGVFYVMLAQFSILFCGLEAGSVTGKVGVLYQFLTLGLAFGGLIACIYLLESNLGELEQGRFYGLQEENPILALFFLLFSLCAVALPLSMGFIGEDLIFHAVVERYPWIGLGLIVTAAINGIALLRITAFLFRGTREASTDGRIPLGLAQKLALAVVMILLFGFGIYPGPLIEQFLAFM